MMNKISLLTASVICMLLLGSCDGDSDDDVIPDIDINLGADDNSKNSNDISAKQVDMTVFVPIHPSSLEYFDYVIHYYDNRGVENRDTIQESSGGLSVDDWNYVDIEITLDAGHRDTIQGSYDGIVVYEWNYANAMVEPIQTSDLEYSDYVIHYYDNRGVENKDTIQGSYGGIVVNDWNYDDIEITLDAENKDTIQGSYDGTSVEECDYENNASLCATNASSVTDNCYIKTFSYDNSYVTCTVTVEMIPKKDITTQMAFFFYIPKPYIFPSVHTPATSLIGETSEHIMETIECIRIDSMTVSSFESAYGRTFTSHCGIYDSYDGYEIFFY